MSSIPYPLDPLGSTNRGPYFELVVKPGILASGLTYGFTPYWNAGGYCKVVDWGDGVGEDAVKSGTLITHTYSVAGTYTILIKAACSSVLFGKSSEYAPLVYDANGNWDALGNITSGIHMFAGCNNAQLPLTSLPEGITDASGMFYNCKKAVINLDELAANAPEGGWTRTTTIADMFLNAGSGNSPGTVTGSRSSFLAKFPNATNTTNAFYGTNTTE